MFKTSDPMTLLNRQTAFFLLIVFSTLASYAQRPTKGFNEKGISKEVLEDYLEHSVTMAEFLAVDPYTVDAAYPNKEDDIRLIKNIGAKFIGRAIYRWGKEAMLTNQDYLNQAATLIKKVQQQDPEVVFQAALFECITQQVNDIPVPDWVFTTFGAPIEKRNFRYNDMLNANGKFVDHWRKGSSVPDITTKEAQYWFMFLAGTYMNIGCEALHLGQIALIGMADPKLEAWAAFLVKVREYAKKHARHKWVLLDAHTPSGGMVVNGKSLLDFNSFPLRIKEVVDKPQEGILQMGYLDALFGRSKACITPSGWSSPSLPFLVEFDNFGISRNPGVADTTSHFIWGYDEVSWFYLQPEKYRQDWLRYAYHWIKEHDSSAFLQMPVSRIVSLGRGKPMVKNRANTRSAGVPDGMNLEETMKDIWSKSK